MNDIYEGHSPNCHAVHPGDRECNCHKAYGFDSQEDMDEAKRRCVDADNLGVNRKERRYQESVARRKTP